MVWVAPDYVGLPIGPAVWGVMGQSVGLFMGSVWDLLPIRECYGVLARSYVEEGGGRNRCA